jgi:pimeloyl-ACP methyl ester carboxylesterase
VAGAAGRMIEVDSLRLHVVVEGEGPAVLLLHGFPDSSHLWRHQIPVLANAGLTVIAPDLRGFGESDMPEAVEAYRLEAVLGDVVGILDALAIERAHVVGHDWGAAVAWGMAALLPQRVDRLVALSVGHPAQFRAASIRQREMSWYMLLFQFAGVAEEALQRDDWRLFRELCRGDGDVDRYIADLSRPGALTAALNWYRANVPPETLFAADPIALPPVACPTMGVWSSGDHYLTEELMTGSEAHVQGRWRYERIEGASHWIPVDAPGELNELLVGFFLPGTVKDAGPVAT